MRWWSIATTLLVVVGAGVGAAVGGVGGLLLGGAIGYLAGRVGDLRTRLAELEQRQAETRQIQLSRPAPAPEPSPPTEEPTRQAPETAEPPQQPDRSRRPEPGRQVDPFPWIEPAASEPDRPGEPSRAAARSGEGDAAPAEPEPAPSGTAPGAGELPGERSVPAFAGVEAHHPPGGSASRLLGALKTWLTTGNAPVKVGSVVLLIGVGFLIREAGRRGIFTLTIEARLIAVAVFAVILLALGWRQRRRRPVYGRSLQGVAIAALYLTTYAAFEVYDLLPAAAAAAAVILITIGAGVLAVTQDARILAVLGIIGGFLAPVLSYSRPEDYVVVFSFYTVLSVAIVGVARFKTWPSLNLLGLAFNFGITTFWLLNRFAEDDWPSLQPFIATFVLIYMALPVVFAGREPLSVRGLWTAPLVFATPFLGLGLQQLVIGHTSRGVAASALVLLGVLAVLHIVARRLGSESGELAVSYAGLSVAFAVIAAPLWLDAYFVTIAWAAQGALLLWYGCRRGLRVAVVGGALVQILAAIAFAIHLADTLPYPDGRLVILNDYFLGATLLAATALSSGYLLNRSGLPRQPVRAATWVALVWGVGWWLSGGLLEIANQAPSWQLPMALVFVVVSLGLAARAAERARWLQLNALGVLILPTLAVVLGLSIVETAHPLGRYGWAAWPVALAVHYWFLRIRDDALGVLRAALHAGGFWILAVLIGVEVYWQVGRVAAGVWAPVSALGAVLLLIAGTLGACGGSAWPFGPHRRVYVAGCIGPVLVEATVVLFLMNLLLDGDPSPLRYLPVLNPLEMLAAPLLVIAFAWRRAAAVEDEHALSGLVAGRWALALAPAGIVVAAMSVARTIHHWRDVPWEFVALARSTELQAALSITWAVIALSTMVVAVRLARRPVWMAGASFMGLVVAKLFFVDLASLGAATRVVSFLGVGALLVAVGYFAPVVPAAKVET